MPLVKQGFHYCSLWHAPVDGSSVEIVKRIVEAYHIAKSEQARVDAPYRVGQMWQDVLDTRFQPLIAALKSRDYAKLNSLLENFQREHFSDGAGGSSGDYSGMMEHPSYRYQYVNTWLKYFERYKSITDGDVKLSYPAVGRPVGMFYNGQVIPSEAIRYHYIAQEISSILADVKHPVVCEIGGGLGGQAYVTVANSERPLTYLILDIPEVLVVATYFLMMSFPDKRFVLYGEDRFDLNSVGDYDFVLAPNFILPRFRNDSVDLFFNSNSFSEMERSTVEEYISQIERICRKYLMHINHTARFKWGARGKETSNVLSTEIRPDKKRFKKIYQHPRIFGKLDDELFYLTRKAEHYHFLYERMNS